MTRQITGYLRGVLSIAVAVGMILSANARFVGHDLTQLAQIVAEHHAEAEPHGHAHDDIVDLMQAYHGHTHEIPDHDHTIAFLPPRAATDMPPPDQSTWGLARAVMGDRRDFGLDRPPRV